MSTLSCSANSCALRSGRTLKPMMMAFEAEANSTSLSVMAPTPDRSTFNRTLSPGFVKTISLGSTSSATIVG